MIKNEKGGLLGYNNPDNIFGRDLEAEEPQGERVLEPDNMERHEYPNNIGPLPPENINID